jgi:hypothetical protein
MMLTKEIMDELKRPFPATEIRFKIQAKMQDNTKGLIVPYLDARNVMDRLDEVCGPDWSDSYKSVVIGGTSGSECSLTVFGVTRTDVGDPDSDGMDKSLKSAYSDAFKRAAVKFGIGRFLYGSPKMYAKIVPVGKSFKIADEEYKNLHNTMENYLANIAVGKVMSEPEPKREAGREWSFEQMDVLDKVIVDVMGGSNNPYEHLGEILSLSVLPENAGLKTVQSWAKKFAEFDSVELVVKAGAANDAYMKAKAK